MADARKLRHLSARSWRDALVRTVKEFQEDNLTDWAAALTYYAVLALFPALIALVSVVGLFGDAQGVTKAITDIVSDVGPQSAADTFAGPIENITADRGRAGVLLALGIAGSIYSASGYIGAFMRASNVIYEIEEGRSFWKRRPLQIAVTVVMVLAVAIVFVTLVLSGPLAESVGQAVGLSQAAITIYGLAKWPVLAVTVMVMLGLLYYASPNVKMAGVRWITPGSLLALVLWVAASAGFALYVAHFGSYDKTYGTLGGVITFLVWLWITNIAVLLGAELNAELERSREIEAGVEGAEEEIKLPPRDSP
jgi:membrane protein